MADSEIIWTDLVWNPTTGCDRVSPGCDNCYALTMAKRLKGMGSAKYQNDGDPRTSGPGFGITMHPGVVTAPLSWRKPEKIFVNSMSDLFHAKVTPDFTARVFAVMALTGRHTYQVLTKRAKRMEMVLTRPGFVDAVAGHVEDILGHSGRRPRWAFDLGGKRLAGDSGQLGEGWTSTTDRAWIPPWPLPNVWLGVSVENQEEAGRRIPHLGRTPAAVRWLSVEPLLEPVDLAEYLASPGECRRCDGAGAVPVPGGGAQCPECEYDRRHWSGPSPLSWVVTGGESGPRHRPADLAWFRTIRDQCADAGVAYFHKQHGGRTPKDGGRLLDGRAHDDYPQVA